MNRFKFLAMAALAVLPALSSPAHAAEGDAVVLANPTVDAPKAKGAIQTAVLAGGCFWGIQGVFEHMKGVKMVLAGYAGGEKANASYRTVSGGNTGHAESVQITYDPAQVSYGELLRIYFSVAHDPTELDRQGNDVGTQYRSEIFAADPMQEKIAKAYIAELDAAHKFKAPIVTKIEPLKGFYQAEAYHQDYLINNPESDYIALIDLPKVENFKRLYPEIYQDKPVMVPDNIVTARF